MMSCTGFGLGSIGGGQSKSTPKKGSSAAASTGGTTSSPLSILEQWQRDAKGAVEDAYANYVLGDDTGESARLVLVASPSEDINLLENTGNGKHPPHILLNDPHTKRNRKRGKNGNGNGNKSGNGNGNGSVKSSQSHGSTNHANNNNLLLFSHLDFYTDANRNSIMGLRRNNNYKQKHDPHASSFMSCGVTYVEINGRAYVHSLDEESAAYQSGVRPRDCVQYAAVLAKEWEEPMGGDFDPISSQALEREDAGQRINFEELKRVFLQGSGILGDLNAHLGNGHLNGYGSYDEDTYLENGNGNGNGYALHHHHQHGRGQHVVMGPPGSATGPPPLPTTIRIGKNPCGGILSQDDYDDGSTVDYSTSRQGNNGNGNRPSSPSSNRDNSSKNTNGNGLGDPRPVVLVFRRTRQRPAKAWNVWPNYRLDDECDVACQILESLTTTGNANGNGNGIGYSALNTGASSPSSNSPRRNNSNTNNANNNKYQSDDASSIWTDGSTYYGDDSVNNQGCTGVGVGLGAGVNKVLFSTNARGGFQDAKHLGLEETDNVEASTIRGMVAKAVGLAFVRSNKVVFGVSVHGGSGIVLSRLSDGTWSSPSLIGMAGMGLGLQVGLEVANYIFILQTPEALEHFSRGGSFTLGANVGAAFAGMGREAIGAASVSPALCGIAQPVQVVKEDEYNFENDEEDEYEYEVVVEPQLQTQTQSPDHPDASFSESTSPTQTQTVRRRRRGGRSGAGCTGAEGCRPGSGHSRGDCAPAAMDTTSMAPIVAYAKSEGLYVGVSLEGSRIFARDEANAKAYKYSSYNHKSVTARDILTGKIVSRPLEAESLYALLHDIELTHEWASLPAVPSLNWLLVPTHQHNNHNKNSHRSSRSRSHSHTEGSDGEGEDDFDWTRPWDANSPACLSPQEFNSNGPDDEPLGEHGNDSESDVEDFASKFLDLLFGGITVTRISPQTQKREKRTLWLSSPSGADGVGGPTDTSNLNSNSNYNHGQKQRNNSSFSKEPERSSLKVGFVSKLYSATAQRKHLSASIINDVQTSSSKFSYYPNHQNAAPEMGDDLTLDSALLDNQSLLTTTGTLQERVELSKKLSMDLVDVFSLTQTTPPEIMLDDSYERDRVICLESSSNSETKLVFLGDTVEETRLLYCGLKLLLEKETARMGIRGGRVASLVNKSGKKHRGSTTITSALRSKNGKGNSHGHSSNHRKSLSAGNHSSTSIGYASSDIDDTDDGFYDPSEYYHPTDSNFTITSKRYPLPEGWKSWGRVPGRSYMRAQSTSTDDGYPTYTHGQLLVREVSKTVLLPLPLPLCRVLLLDSSSPVVSKWETERGDSDFERTPWTFPPATPREMEQFQSEHQLIASGSMSGAHRTISYERYRNGRPVRLSETHIVDCDDSEKLQFQVSERLPRRGFSIKAKILLRAVEHGGACEATVLGEIRPVGKNMSDPAAVHKALLKVLDELRNRYGTDPDCEGLLAGFMNVIENMPRDEVSHGIGARVPSGGLGLGLGLSSSSHSSSWRSGWEEKKESDATNNVRSGRKVLGKTSVVKFEDVMSAELGISEVADSRFASEKRPGNSSASDYKSRKNAAAAGVTAPEGMDTFGNSCADPVTIEVKPLPKIRLSLMPSPREEDEENLDDEGEPKSRRRSGGKSSKTKRSPFGKKKPKHRRKTSS